MENWNFNFEMIVLWFLVSLIALSSYPTSKIFFFKIFIIGIVMRVVCLLGGIGYIRSSSLLGVIFQLVFWTVLAHSCLHVHHLRFGLGPEVYLRRHQLGPFSMLVEHRNKFPYFFCFFSRNC